MSGQSSLKTRLSQLGYLLIWLGLIGLSGFLLWLSDQPALGIGSASDFNLANQESFNLRYPPQRSEVALALASRAGFSETYWIEYQIKSDQRPWLAGDQPLATEQLGVDPNLRTKADIIRHQVLVGQTVASLARDYSLSPETIRQSNNLGNKEVEAGQEILIAPEGIDGIVHQLTLGQTWAELAEIYEFNRQAAADFNNLVEEELVGELIFLPQARLKSLVKNPVSFSGQPNTQPRAPLPNSRTKSCYGCRQRVAAGDLIGKIGNTGWSSGPHLHLEIYDQAGVRTDPWSFLVKNKLTWPAKGRISQGYKSSHRALDIAASEGQPVVAIADGEIIFRGCGYLGSNKATFIVVIDHGGWYSMSIHLQAPDNSLYNSCNRNLYPGRYYRNLSVDYQTKR